MIEKKCKHVTVLLKEAIDSLNIHRDGIYIDGTFGCGGHSRLILSKLGKNGRLLAIDRDPQTAFIANTIRDPRFSYIHGQFSRLDDYAKERKLTGKVNGILLDLGLSYRQVQDHNRGFSFTHDGPLDMRMDPTTGRPASELLHITKESDIAWVLKNFGEERFYKKIAHAISKYNQKCALIRTKELVEITMKIIPKKNQLKYKHPATRTFQAIRIWVNNELKEIESALQHSLNVLALGGRLSIISFHSLESRIVKRFMRKHSSDSQVLKKLPITENTIKQFNHYQLRELGKLVPSKEEIKKNICSRSAVLRFAEKIR